MIFRNRFKWRGVTMRICTAESPTAIQHGTCGKQLPLAAGRSFRAASEVIDRQRQHRCCNCRAHSIQCTGLSCCPAGFRANKPPRCAQLPTCSTASERHTGAACRHDVQTATPPKNSRVEYVNTVRLDLPKHSARATHSVGGRPADAAADEPWRAEPGSTCPVFVMLPLDTVHVVTGADGREESLVQSSGALSVALDKIKQAKVKGVMVDVWWGIVERAGPGQYDWAAYRALFDKVKAAGLELQVVMSFHAAGTNVGDTCTISLPPWVLAAAREDPDILFTDAARRRNTECLSTGCLEEPVLLGRSPRDAYTEFVAAFAREFGDLIGDVISEVTVGCGPAGELRYPSYPEGDGRWRFPGVGEFQCYDKYLLASLKAAAERAGHPEWGGRGPHDAGSYNSRFWECEFFRNAARWDSEYGRFFLGWYSDCLVRHADVMLGAVSATLRKECPAVILDSVTPAAGNQPATYSFKARGDRVRVGLKLAGVHWCAKSDSHAAELTAGYYNTATRNGYAPILNVLRKHGAVASFTCVEMRDCEHPEEAACGPEPLLEIVSTTAAELRVPLTGENALQRYDKYAFRQMYKSALCTSAARGRLAQLTFLRMGNLFLDNWGAFNDFMELMAPGDAAPPH